MEEKNVETNEMENVANATEELVESKSNVVGIQWTDIGQAKALYKYATALAKGNAIPDRFKNNPGDVLIAMDIASRSNQSLPMVLNNMYSVYGTIGFSGQYCISVVNNSGKFSELKFMETNNGGGGMIAYATRLSDGELCKSEEITMDLARKEGWLDKKGSKWQTFPKQMQRYRSASFFVRAFCPELLYGYQTIEEIQDLKGYDNANNETTTITLD